MTRITVSDAAVEAAFKAYARASFDVKGYPDPNYPMRAAIEAALAELLEAVGFKEPHREYLMHSRCREDYAAGLLGDAGKKVAARFTEQVYRLRHPTPGREGQGK